MSDEPHEYWEAAMKSPSSLIAFSFTLPDTIARGELRPLRDPQTAGIDEA